MSAYGALEKEVIVDKKKSEKYRKKGQFTRGY